MFSWFKTPSSAPLVFTGNDEAFAYACSNQRTRFLLYSLIPALVEESGRPGSEGERYFHLRLATKEGGTRIWACTLKEATSFPRAGDFVGFRVVKIASDLPAGMNLIGYIAVRLEPKYVVSRGWCIAENYTPQDIKPELHL